MSLDINKIASEKITSMVESGEIEKLIAVGVENNVKKAIDSACSSYQWRNEIEDNIKKTLGSVASKVDFSAYSNFLSDRLAKQMNESLKGEMLEAISKSFEKIYVKVPENITLSYILSLYQKHLEDTLDYDDKRDWGRISFSFIKDGSIFIKIKAGKPDCITFDFMDKGLDFTLIVDKDKSAHLGWINFNGNNFETSMDLTHLSDIEILYFNLMFTKASIEIDIDEDFCFDVDFEDAEEEY